ncbi:hypothetical protein SAMN05216466_106207 [Paraburkholderia phenazinium]|uniref:Glycine zipper n=1 Tax=Paraburkholderia phenazinium TaxID=60549 RepID=A0A1G7YKM5_9BURK|nr:hypothetical protein [Paraburkholderia phenazinium]SDG96390.1 hypothetical protein SAMN05216466_106207 [Paraburkholderia phenazinium]
MRTQSLIGWAGRSLAVVGLVGLTACSTFTDMSEGLGNKMGISNQTGGAAAGGAVLGCLGGGAVGVAIGFATGHGLAGAGIGCAGGAVLGGGGAAISSEAKQLAEQRKNAEQLQTQLRQTDATVQVLVATKTIPAQPAANGKPASKEMQGWENTTVGLTMAGMQTHDPKVAAFIAKAGELASKSSTPVIINVYVLKKNGDWVRGILDSAIPDGNKTAAYIVHTVTSAAKQKLVLSPSPT